MRIPINSLFALIEIVKSNQQITLQVNSTACFSALVFVVLPALPQCAHKPAATAATATEQPVEWQVVSDKPLTYAPKGFSIPPTTSSASGTLLHVFNHDRSVHYVVPSSGYPRHLETALKVRDKSIPASSKTADFIGDALGYVGGGLLSTGAALAPAMARSYETSRTEKAIRERNR